MKKVMRYVYLLGINVVFAVVAMANVNGKPADRNENKPGAGMVRLKFIGSCQLDATVHQVHKCGRDKLVTRGNYQYSTYYDEHDLYLVLTRRDLTTNEVQKVKFTGLADKIDPPQDEHQYISMGASPDGRLHISYNNHSTEHHYRVSEAGWLDNPVMDTGKFSDNIAQLPGGGSDMWGEKISTYPQYFNSKDGSLFFSYRNARSNDNGNQILHRYVKTGDAWEWRRVGTGIVIHGRSGTPGFSSPPGNYEGLVGGLSGNRYSYTYGFRFDKNDRLHIMWTWNERDVSTLKGADHGDDHDICYAYSDDYGMTWYNNKGDAIADLADSDNPIRIGEAEVIDMPQMTGTHWGAMYLDNENRPHLYVMRYDQPTVSIYRANYHAMHYWRSENGDWHGKWVSDKDEYSNCGLYIGYSFFDTDNNCYILYDRDYDDYLFEGRAIAGGANLDNLHWQEGGYIGAAIHNVKSEIASQFIEVPVANNKIVKLCYRNVTSATSAKLWFVTDDDTKYSESKSVTFPVTPNDTGYTEYVLDMAQNPAWDGILKGLKFAPALDVATGGFSLDYIRIGDGTYTAKAFEFSRGPQLKCIRLSAADGYNTMSEFDVLPEGIYLPSVDAGFYYDEPRFAQTGILSVPVGHRSNVDGYVDYAVDEFVLTGTLPEPPPGNPFTLTVTAQEGGELTGTENTGRSFIVRTGEKVKIGVKTLPGYIFSGWKATSGKIFRPAKPETAFQMPEEDAEIIATFIKTPVYKAWEFDSNKEGWEATGIDTVTYGVLGGRLKGAIDKVDTELKVTTVDLDISDSKARYLQIKFTTPGTHGRIRWQTVTTGVQKNGWRSRDIYFKPGENLVTIDMRGEKDWDGELINLAFTPACDVSSATFGIDYIRLLNCEAEVSFCNQTSPFRNKKQ